jgi:hypothetical protein
MEGSGICQEGLSKATKNVSQDSRSLGQDLSPGPPEYEAGVSNHLTATFGAEVKNAWSYTSTPPYIFTMWRLI